MANIVRSSETNTSLPERYKIIRQNEISLDIDSRIRTIFLRRLNKRFSSNFLEGYSDRQTPEKGQKEQQSKRYDNNDKNEVNSPNVDNN